jgi:hypothetical protein
MSLDRRLKGVTGLPKARMDKLSFSGSADTTGTALTAGKHYMLFATADCHLHFNTTSTAATTSNSQMVLTAGAYVTFYADSSSFVSAIQVSSSGDLYITDLGTD